MSENLFEKSRLHASSIYNGMRILSVMIFKGGVGKSFTASNLAIRAASGHFPHVKKRVLLVDIDGQQNTSRAFLHMESSEGESNSLPPVHPSYDPFSDDDVDWNGRCSSSDLYYGNPVEPYPSLVHDNLDILPADGSSLELFERGGNANGSMLDLMRKNMEDFFNDPGVQERYDLIIFDCPPGLSLITAPLLRVTTDIIMPCEPERMSVEGLNQVFASVQKANKQRELPINVVGVIPNKCRNLRVHKNHLDALRMGSSEKIKESVANFEINDRTCYKWEDLPFMKNTRANIEYKNPKAEQEMNALVSFVKERMYDGIA